MVEIISKRNGPRREDVQIKRILHDNRATIARIADQISNGQYSANKQPRSKPQAQGLIIHALSGSTKRAAEPAVRISVNGRVIVVDQNTGRQLHHLGDLRVKDGAEVFVLATAANGYFAPLDDAYAQALQSLDGQALGAVDGEDHLTATISSRLGIA